MADYCLIPALADKFLKAIESGTLSPEKLTAMTSEGRRKVFSEIIGEKDAKAVNQLFESKMILKDQKRGMENWINKVAGLSQQAKRDFISRVNRMEKALSAKDEEEFLSDLAEKKLGMSVTYDEAKNITDGAKRIDELSNKFDPVSNTWSSEEDRLAYGSEYVAYQKYVAELMRDAGKKSAKEILTDPVSLAETISGSAKGIVASLDNSFFGRQGLKVFWTNPDVWANGFKKSWGDIVSSLRGGDPIDVIKADIFSRPNAMNGRYSNMKLAIGIDFEEAFPSSLPEKIPYLGRLYKASEAAYNGAALRLRADIADKYIPLAESNGVNMASAGHEAQAIGRLVNSLTGRGEIRMLSEKGKRVVNSAFFSIRYLKSNFDFLTMHVFDHAKESGGAATFVRRQAANNLLRVAGGTGGVLGIASILWPNSVDQDPRSSNFGKIVIGDTRFDVTGGMGALSTFFSRMMPSYHNGVFGLWFKSSTTGKWTDLTAGGYGKMTPKDVIESFATGKLSPVFGQALAVLTQQQFGGQPVTAGSIAQNLLVPMSFQTFMDAMNDKNSAGPFAATVLDGIGIGASTYGSKFLPPRDVWGEPMPKGGIPDDDFIKPIRDSDQTQDPVGLALKELNYNPSKPRKEINGIELTDDQYDRYMEISGKYAKLRLSQIVNSPAWSAISDTSKEDIIKSVIADARESARSTIKVGSIGSENDILAKSLKARLSPPEPKQKSGR